MYPEHFKLSDQPFNNSPGDGVFTPNEQFKSAVASMERVLLSRDAVAIITGGPGVGKTTIVSTAAKRVEDKATVVHIDMRLTSPDLLYDLLLLNLGGESGNGDMASTLVNLRDAILRHNEEQGRRITVVIDVSSLTIERAKRILQLVHMTGEPGGQLNIVLLGPHVLHKLLDTPGLIHMRQRVIFRYRVRPLTVAETDAYINHQLERCGGQPNSVLEHGTSIMVYQYVGGVPRLINTLMVSALNFAAEKDIQSITPDLLTEAAKFLGWRRMSSLKAASNDKNTSDSTAADSEKKSQPGPFDSISKDFMPGNSSNTGTHDATANTDNTASLMAAALDADPDTENDESKPADTTSGSEDPKSGISGMPEMDASDTSATGMLRLEDLDARFAETVFGEDPNLFKIDEEPEKAAS